MERFLEIEKIIEQYVNEEDGELSNYFVGGASDNKISMAEEKLGVNFPNSYKLFLKKYGTGGIDGIMFWGIEENKDTIDKCTVVAITEEYRKKGLPNKLVVFEENGDSVTCLDTENMNENNECPIVTWSIYDEDGVVFLDEDFCSYFLELVEECI